MNPPAESPPSQLSPDDRRRLLARMLQEKASRPAERPLSLGQERIRLMTRLDPDSPLYNIAVAYRLHGPLDLAALEQGVRRIAGRHEMLRATFPAEDDRSIELVSPDAPPAFAVSDHRDLPEDGREARIIELATEAVAAPVRPGAGPALARRGHPVGGRGA